MATIRFKALELQTKRSPVQIKLPQNEKISDYFGINVFDKSKMKKYLSKEVYKKVIDAIEKGTKIDRTIADQVANGMKTWAISRGATHYTHWFHPLTEASAEKHDSFLQLDEKGLPFETFDGDKLSQQEPDASSFPSGGIRNTFEARGYTAWDPSSPAFIIGKTLCIPTIFVSYTGEALDYKTPLLKSLKALDKAATQVAKMFNPETNKVISTLGWEQEYFLIDDALYQARPDLQLTGRTLMGHASAKDQQLDDHYFGSIPERVMSFMQDFEFEAHKLGIPIRTRHNEVAPNQFECAPQFEETNLAVDHNMLLMDLMVKVARRHNFRVLLHEKPFKDVNGSGKHNNWSLATDTGINLLAPGKNKETNLRFLVFLVNTIKAVHDNADLLRASIITAGNEHRLGANEAPPAIISVFVGEYLSKTLKKLAEKDIQDIHHEDSVKVLEVVEQIPEILLDNTDRNRTSPFAFTGNRFEFRAVGASANPASPMIVLNTAVAHQLNSFKKQINLKLKNGENFENAVIAILHNYINDAKKILFEGNNYSEHWILEAQKRGLTNIDNVPDAIKSYIQKQSIELLENNNVLTEREIKARYEVLLENFTKKIQIESRVLGDMAINHIIPTAIKYQNILIQNVQGLKQIFDEQEYREMTKQKIETIRQIDTHINEIRKQVFEMTEQRKNANARPSCQEKSEYYNKNVKPYLNKIRYHIDKLELIIDDELWPLPKYREILFNR